MKPETFEEKFPEFKGQFGNCEGHLSRLESMDCIICGRNHTMTFEYFKKVVQEHCLDKQRVKEAFIKFMNKECLHCEGHEDQGTILWNDFRKILGDDEE